MKNTKKGQVKLSFGMIFSIILIIVFLVFAFYAIKTFLKIQYTAQAGKFISDLRSDIDRVWKSTESSEEKEYALPKKIDYVCFVDFSVSATGENAYLYDELKKIYYDISDNMMFYPALGSSTTDSTKIESINLEEITEDENPFCIENVRGKIELTLVKEIGEALVRITR